MKKLLCLLVLGLMANSATGQENLLEGKTLADFGYFLADNGVQEEVFQLADGVLKISGTPMGWLETKKDYKNFTLKAEIRYPEENPNANSGLFLRLVGRGPAFLPPCVEVQMKTGNIGDVFGFWGYTVLGDAARAKTKENAIGGKMHTLTKIRCAQKPGTDAWNQVEITCFEEVVVVRVNGVIVNVAYGVQNVPGKIAFQSEGGVVWFRNAVVTEE
ncbi:MAG: DUF1080 domain-containing protein [Planctomycetia bacterium]|nr:DUF1080 domain-containing protein [Planctomycetia bacterium]